MMGYVNWVESPCLTCAGPLAVGHRPLSGMSSNTVIGALLAGALLVGAIVLTAPKNKGALQGIFGRRRRRRRR